MQSFHIVLKGHELGETLGAKNIKIAQSFGLNASLHPGVSGDTCMSLYKKYNINSFLHKGMRNPGQRGCFLAHFQLWQKCLELDQPIVICEHDGVFLRSLPNNILDFNHVLRLDSFKHWQEDYEDNIKTSTNSKVQITTLPTEFITHYVGYYGYVIKPEGALTLINHAQQVGVMPVDQFIDNRIVDIKSVTASIVRLDETYNGKGATLSTTYNYNNAKR